MSLKIPYNDKRTRHDKMQNNSIKNSNGIIYVKSINDREQIQTTTELQATYLIVRRIWHV